MLSAAIKPLSVPVRVGSTAPKVLVAASGVTEAAFRPMVKAVGAELAALKVAVAATEAVTV